MDPDTINGAQPRGSTGHSQLGFELVERGNGWEISISLSKFSTPSPSQFARFLWLTIFGHKSHVQYHIHGVCVYTTFKVSMFIAWVWGRGETGHNRPPKITLRVSMFIAWVWGRGETGHNRPPMFIAWVWAGERLAAIGHPKSL